MKKVDFNSGIRKATREIRTGSAAFRAAMTRQIGRPRGIPASALSVPEEFLNLDVVAAARDKRIPFRILAKLYALAIVRDFAKVDWRALNAAIDKRCLLPYGAERCKGRAWKEISRARRQIARGRKT